MEPIAALACKSSKSDYFFSSQPKAFVLTVSMPDVKHSHIAFGDLNVKQVGMHFLVTLQLLVLRQVFAVLEGVHLWQEYCHKVFSLIAEWFGNQSEEKRMRSV